MSGSHKLRRSWRHRVCVPYPCNTVKQRLLKRQVRSTLKKVTKLMQHQEAKKILQGCGNT
jgi:hypothetical protein